MGATGTGRRGRDKVAAPPCFLEKLDRSGRWRRDGAAGGAPVLRPGYIPGGRAQGCVTWSGSRW